MSFFICNVRKRIQESPWKSPKGKGYEKETKYSRKSDAHKFKNLYMPQESLNTSRKSCWKTFTWTKNDCCIGKLIKEARITKPSRKYCGTLITPGNIHKKSFRGGIYNITQPFYTTNILNWLKFSQKKSFKI